jgi:hypothetical protein
MAKKNWIKGAIKRPGAFRKKAKAAGMSTRAYAQKMKDAPGRTGKQARLALTLMGMKAGKQADAVEKA